jgi:hypothetical protein
MSALSYIEPPPTIEERLAALPRPKRNPVPMPVLTHGEGQGRAFLGIESFRRHMSSEGWQLQAGLHEAGYELCGKGLPHDCTDVPTILDAVKPHTLILQDKREWDSADQTSIVKGEDFRRWEELGNRPDIFKLTIIKDAQHNGPDIRQVAQTCGIHAWIVYYNPTIVEALSPGVRKDCLIRTYHTVNPGKVPPFAGREGLCLLSGAVAAGVYPLRMRLMAKSSPKITRLHHPGYHANGTNTNDFLQQISMYKVAICTCSIYGYALRKIIEATACGCRVITDLPPDEVMPEIDGNLVRVSPNAAVNQIEQLVDELAAGWDYNTQRSFAEKALTHYNFRTMTTRLALSIEAARKQVLQGKPPC